MNAQAQKKAANIRNAEMLSFDDQRRKLVSALSDSVRKRGEAGARSVYLLVTEYEKGTDATRAVITDYIANFGTNKAFDTDQGNRLAYIVCELIGIGKLSTNEKGVSSIAPANSDDDAERSIIQATKQAVAEAAPSAAYLLKQGGTIDNNGGEGCFTLTTNGMLSVLGRVWYSPEEIAEDETRASNRYVLNGKERKSLSKLKDKARKALGLASVGKKAGTTSGATGAESGETVTPADVQRSLPATVKAVSQGLNLLRAANKEPSKELREELQILMAEVVRFLKLGHKKGEQFTIDVEEVNKAVNAG